MHTSSGRLLKAAFGPVLKRSTALPPAFLIPSIVAQSTAFSTTPSLNSKNNPHKVRKDGNPERAVSALHRRGPKKIERLEQLVRDIPSAKMPDIEQVAQELKEKAGPGRHFKGLTSAYREALQNAIAESLPKPVLDPDVRSSVEVDADHGLWQFFNEERTPMSTPLQLSNHGRAWTTNELRAKDWEDLWRLWWVCLKERNRLETFRFEKKRIGGQMYGDYEVEMRMDEIEKTMKGIKAILTERWYAWEDARVAAMEDEEVDLYADPKQGQDAYKPKEPELDKISDGEGQLEGKPRSTYHPHGTTSPSSEARV